MRDLPLAKIFAGVTPFVIADIVALALILVLPVIAVGLVELTR
ncbi:MAG: hypothetical protein R3E68_01780 [Burkholderiaceae bacterium]